MEAAALMAIALANSQVRLSQTTSVYDIVSLLYCVKMHLGTPGENVIAEFGSGLARLCWNRLPFTYQRNNQLL